MDEQRIGRSVRALRTRLGLRQEDLARRARVSQTTVSRIERGRSGPLPLVTIRAVVQAVGADLDVVVRWDGARLDRLLDGRHAALLAETTRRLERDAWIVHPEVSYSVYGERGSIDLVAWHSRRRALLVVEAKTAITSLEEMLRRHDQKTRLAPGIVRERFGWEVAVVGSLVVLPDASTPRRHVARADLILSRAYPLRGHAVRAWLADPIGAAAGLQFLSSSLHGSRGRPGGRLRSARPASPAVLDAESPSPTSDATD